MTNNGGTKDECTVPLSLEGVIIGRVSISDQGSLEAEITSDFTMAYIKELLLANEVEGVALSLSYISEPDEHVPTENHLRVLEGELCHEPKESSIRPNYRATSSRPLRF